MQSAKIIALALLAAVAYGILHDQITARVCLEYFTVFHHRALASDSPTLHAFYWGVVATWWMGLGLGIPIALFARCGKEPKLTARDLWRPFLCLMAASGILSAAMGVTGYLLAEAGRISLWQPWADLVPPARHSAFLADLWAHRTAYGVGFFGSIVIWGWCVRRRNVHRSKTKAMSA